MAVARRRSRAGLVAVAREGAGGLAGRRERWLAGYLAGAEMGGEVSTSRGGGAAEARKPRHAEGPHSGTVPAPRQQQAKKAARSTQAGNFAADGAAGAGDQKCAANAGAGMDEDSADFLARESLTAAQGTRLAQAGNSNTMGGSLTTISATEGNGRKRQRAKGVPLARETSLDEPLEVVVEEEKSATDLLGTSQDSSSSMGFSLATAMAKMHHHQQQQQQQQQQKEEQQNNINTNSATINDVGKASYDDANSSVKLAPDDVYASGNCSVQDILANNLQGGTGKSLEQPDRPVSEHEDSGPLISDDPVDLLPAPAPVSVSNDDVPADTPASPSSPYAPIPGHHTVTFGPIETYGDDFPRTSASASASAASLGVVTVNTDNTDTISNNNFSPTSNLSMGSFSRSGSPVFHYQQQFNEDQQGCSSSTSSAKSFGHHKPNNNVIKEEDEDNDQDTTSGGRKSHSNSTITDELALEDDDAESYGRVYKSVTVRLGEAVTGSDETIHDDDIEQKGNNQFDHTHSSRMVHLPAQGPAEPPSSLLKPPMPLTWKDGDVQEASPRPGKKRMIGDKYEIISLIGRGAQGTVMKCRHIDTNEFVAIKTVKGGSLVVGTTAMPRNVGRRRRKGGSGMSSVMKQVSREIALLKKVNHPNIVRLLEIVDVTTDRDIHLVFEYVSGGPLRQLSDQLLLKNSGVPLPEDEARDYFRQLCSAVRYLHHHGIMHRDIKPSNLIIDRVKRQLKLTDLGIAAQTRQGKANKILGNDDDLIATTLVVGTPAFLPPEFYRIKANEEALQERMLRDADDMENAAATQETALSLTRESSVLGPRPEQFIPGRAADIWAMGVTLYAFIYGGLPFTQRRRQSRGSFSQMRKFTTFSSAGSTSSLERDGSAAYSSGERDEPRNGSDDRSPSPLDLVVSPLRRKRSSRAPLTQEEMQQRILENPLRFPGTGLGTSMRLRVLLQRMLDKDPRSRATMDEICSHDWVCRYEPLSGLSQEQMTSIQISKKDQEHAIYHYSSVFVRMQRALRGMRSKAHIFGSGIRSSDHSFHQSRDSRSMDDEDSDLELDDLLQPS